MQNDLIFEWDNEKNLINIKKHKVDFMKAIGVFADNNRIEKYDAQHSEKESRWQTIGKNGEILFVVYAERGLKNEIIRIISARKATKEEKDGYYKNIGIEH